MIQIESIDIKWWKRNNDIVKTILELLGKEESHITFVKDRPGHDYRYALDNTRIRKELGGAFIRNSDDARNPPSEPYRNLLIGSGCMVDVHDPYMIVSIVGARPQFIKCAPLSRKLRKVHHEILVHTGQHYDYDISDVFFEELNIPKPDYNLGIGSGNHGEQTGKMLTAIEKVLLEEKPDLMLVYGDTNSTLAGALAAVKLHIKVAHVEAGLRSFDRSMPEEINRVLTDHISDILFCPTQTAVDNLSKEGITQVVHLVGDVMLDALDYNLKVAKMRSRIIEELGLEKKKYLVATVHRPGNTDSSDNIRSIIEALGESSMPVVFPVHPRTEKFLQEYGLLERMPGNVRLIKPLGYLDMLMLMANARKILTDSGGIQKEAYMLGVPCVTLRENTEWVETLEGRWNVLVGADKRKIIEAALGKWSIGTQRKIFGSKRASKRIMNILPETYYRGEYK